MDGVGHAFDLDLVSPVEDAPSRLAIAARYIFGPQVFSALRDTAPGHSGEIQLTDAVRILLSAGCPVWCVRLEGGCRRYDIGNFDSYFKAFVEISLQDPELGEGLRAHLASLLKEEA